MLVYGAKKGFVCFRVLWLCWHVNGTSPRDKDMTHPFIISGHVFWPQNGSRVAHCNGFLLEGQRRCTTNGRIRNIWKLFSHKKVCLYLCLLDMSRCEAVSLCTCHLHGYRGRTSSYLRNHTWNVVTFVVCLFLWSMNHSAAINACVSCGFLFAVLVVQRRKKSLCVCVWCVYKGTFVICRMCWRLWLLMEPLCWLWSPRSLALTPTYQGPKACCFQNNVDKNVVNNLI